MTKPLSKRGFVWLIIAIITLSLAGVFASGAPWWVYPVFVVVGCLGCREILIATYESFKD